MISNGALPNIRKTRGRASLTNIISRGWSTLNCTKMCEMRPREKQLKGWKKDKKVSLIEALNPKWSDLSASAKLNRFA
jgi:hypothetical protein